MKTSHHCSGTSWVYCMLFLSLSALRLRTIPSVVALVPSRRRNSNILRRNMSQAQEGDVAFGRFVIPAASVFYRTAHSYAFVNLRPLVPGHVLVISQERVATLAELSTDAYTDLWNTVRHVQRAVLAPTYTTGAYNVAVQDGRAAGQSVPHVHVHILPRHDADVYNAAGRNDDIYTDLEVWAPRPELVVPRPSLQVPADDERRDRTLAEMAQEAALYRQTLEDKSETMDDIDVAQNLQLVRASMTQVTDRSVRLVAVSKTKPIELLLKAYDEGECRIFGENYAQELVQKVPQMANDVQWHFIGGLQSNKVNMLVNAFDDLSRLVVETVDKQKLANKLNTAAAGKVGKLRIFVQVNTSGEESKSGCEPSEVVELCQQIVNGCKNLQLMGLMTIGAPGDLSCFDKLVDCRNQVQEKLGSDLELSMGMSGDYLQAIEKGATNVRVGSTIFGARNYANKA